jgi:hypothetical protein
MRWVLSIVRSRILADETPIAMRSCQFLKKKSCGCREVLCKIPLIFAFHKNRVRILT